jgi:carboxyl-terminal processing protease
MNTQRILKRIWRTLAAALVAAAVTASTSAPASLASSAGCHPADAPPTSNAPATSLTTVRDAFRCVLAHYPDRHRLDDRLLLQGAFAAMVAYLGQHGLDQADATLPPLVASGTTDWTAFARTFTTISAHLPAHGRSRAAAPAAQLAASAIEGLVASLNDDHAHYIPTAATASAGSKKIVRGPAGQSQNERVALGLETSYPSHPTAVPPSAPLFILDVEPRSPAARAGVRAGDVITSIDGSTPFTAGVANEGAISRLGSGSAVRLSIRRPRTGHTWSLLLEPASYPLPQNVSVRLLAGNIAYLRIRQFLPGASDQALESLHRLNRHHHLAGLVLDLRGNGGGFTTEPPRLLGAFVHNAVMTRFIDGNGHRTVQRTDATVPLLHLPLVALIDNGCASACDATATAIHDLHLGRLVGARTAGSVSGPANLFALPDGSLITLPLSVMTGPDGEIVDGIGVPPDDNAPLTANALSAGRDPGLVQALRDLHVR